MDADDSPGEARLTLREILERDWAADSCDYKSRVKLFYVELSLSHNEAQTYAKMSFAALPEKLKDCIEGWYIRANQESQDKKRKGKK